MTIPPTGRVLALDWGTARIGVAISDETQLVATPVDTFSRREGRRLPIGKFLTLIEREKPVGLVVGLPLDDDGMEGPAAIAAREMGRSLAARSGLPVAWIDESFTTASTLEAIRDTGGRPRPDAVDARAAATILQQWLDARR
jgi:putative Holliday junction resolvase